MKKIISLFMVSVILLSLAVLPANAAYVFISKDTYKNQFSDVSESDWFFEYVKASFEFGLMKGSSDTTFSPASNLTLAEAITIASRIRSLYTTGNELSVYTVGDEAWYIPYVRYAIDNGMIGSEKQDYNALAKRSDVAKLFARALPQEAYSVTAEYPDNSIPDVPMTASYSGEVYKLYRAGILSGSDQAGTFNPESPITRSEIATICVRIANPEKRIHKSIVKAPEAVPEKKELTAEEISEKCAEAVFYIETYYRNGKIKGSGSGFFISEDGYALTNHHVVADTGYIEITLLNGKKYHGATVGYLNKNNLKLVDFDADRDLALLKIDDGTFPYIEIGDSKNIKQGQKAYALGSPMGLQNTLSQGIISQPKLTDVYPVPLIQISVPIAHGSSGGVLLNSYGQAIGVTTGGIGSAAADLNWAVPIHEAESLRKTVFNPKTEKLDSFGISHHYVGPCDYATYPYAKVPDFGEFSGVKLVDSGTDLTRGLYKYDYFDFHDAFEYDAGTNYSLTILQYPQALKLYGFELVDKEDNDDERYKEYHYTNGYLDLEFLVYYNRDSDLDVGIYVYYEYHTVYYEEKDYPEIMDFGWFAEMDFKWDPEPATSNNNNYLFFYYDTEGCSDSYLMYCLNEYMDYLGSIGYNYMVPKNGNASPHITSVKDTELRKFENRKDGSAVGICLEKKDGYIAIILQEI